MAVRKSLFLLWFRRGSGRRSPLLAGLPLDLSHLLWVLAGLKQQTTPGANLIQKVQIASRNRKL